MAEMYVSVDIEASGPVPCLYSMLALGACVVGDTTKTFYRELKPLHDDFIPEAIAVPMFSDEVMSLAKKRKPDLGKEMSILCALEDLGSMSHLNPAQLLMREWLGRSLPPADDIVAGIGELVRRFDGKKLMRWLSTMSPRQISV